MNFFVEEVATVNALHFVAKFRFHRNCVVCLMKSISDELDVCFITFLNSTGPK